MELEFVRLREFAHTTAQANQSIFAKIFGQLQNLFGHIIHFITLLSEAVGAVRSIDEVFHIFADTVKIAGEMVTVEIFVLAWIVGLCKCIGIYLLFSELLEKDFGSFFV